MLLYAAQGTVQYNSNEYEYPQMWFKWIFFSSITVSSKKFKTAGTSKLQGLKTPGGRREPGARDTHTRGEHTVTGYCTIEGEGLQACRVRAWGEGEG